MKINEILTEDALSFESLLKAAGYRPGTTHHQPVRDADEGKVWALEKLLKQHGFPRTKSPNSNKYEYRYDVNGETIVFNYRFGNCGLAAWWRTNLNETTTAGGIATVASGQGSTFTRNASIYGSTKAKKKKKAGKFANSKQD